MYTYTSGDENHLCGVSLHESQDFFESQGMGAGDYTVVCQSVARVIA